MRKTGKNLRMHQVSGLSAPPPYMVWSPECNTFANSSLEGNSVPYIRQSQPPKEILLHTFVKVSLRGPLGVIHSLNSAWRRFDLYVCSTPSAQHSSGNIPLTPLPHHRGRWEKLSLLLAAYPEPQSPFPQPTTGWWAGRPRTTISLPPTNHRGEDGDETITPPWGGGV